MYIMIFTYKNKKYVSVPAPVPTQKPRVKHLQDATAKVPAKIKYNMFAPINNAGCNYCGIK
jgi:hypothetical protein